MTTNATRWIARDLSHLYTREHKQPAVYDVVIVGSGYGGAMAAAELAGRKDAMGKDISVLVLERGKEYVPGMFPSSGQELPTRIRFHRSKSGKTTGWLDGLLDFRIGADVCALVGNGLGGGSLINAGVMEIPDWSEVPRMPGSVTRALDVAAMNQVKERLGARAGGVDNTIDEPANFGALPPKAAALRAIAPAKFHPAAITVEMRANPPDSRWKRCEQCGDCMTGCNVGAKKSLDTTLLHEAHSRGAEIFTGASVTTVRRAATPGQWELCVVFTGESLRRRHAPLVLRANHVILAAGTLGTPEILLRSQTFALQFSPRLGQQFSCNGDNILAVERPGTRTNSVGDEYKSLVGRGVGPTIAGVLREPAVQIKDGACAPSFLLQEFAVPGSIKRIFEEIVTTSTVLTRLATKDDTDHTDDASARDPLTVDPGQIDQMLVLGIIGHDESAGQLRLPPIDPMDDASAVEGRIRIDWPEARKSRLVDDAFARAGKMIGTGDGKPPILPNPLWKMLPDELDFVFRSERGPLLTVHPLGGCPIGADRTTGAVDEYGQLFDANIRLDDDAVHAGLRVLDGSILPSSLGVNPALTIAAIAQRAARQLAGSRGWIQGAAGPVAPPRPRARTIDECTPDSPKATEVEVIEKLCGPFRSGGKSYVAELTLAYVPKSLESLCATFDRRMQVAAGDLSNLRIYDKSVWDGIGVRFLEEPARRQHALAQAPLTGELSLLQREPSAAWWRTLRGIVAYGVNRGLRDAVANWSELSNRPKWFSRLLALASRAGEVRRFDYRITIGKPSAITPAGQAMADLLARHADLVGEKRFTYRCRGNPWRQLTELRLTRFLGLGAGAAPLLVLDGRFIARQAVPLARITQQANQVHALAESASFALYFLRLFVSIHLWTLRAPDRLPARNRKLLPGPIKGLPAPVVCEIELEPPRHGIPVLVRLTRYRREQELKTPSTKPPLVMIHGYSASGSSFTHEAIPEPMARYFCSQGRDVWVLDLRTSAGMASALLPWNFEDAALADIPVAIAHILCATGQQKVDVFAHCIGAVMLSMAILTTDDEQQWDQINAVEPPDGMRSIRHKDAVSALPASIRKIVLSQKGPALVYSDGNVLRGYLMRVLRALVLPSNYQFRAAAHQSLADQALDRMLSSLPYPDAELKRENPTWPWAKTPWVGFRHRLDALYARAFKLENLNDETLAALEDLFGPLNLDTVAQAVNFARFNKITNGAGRNCFVTVTRMRDRWPRGGTMSLHGCDNGLADVRTVSEMEALMREAGLPLESRRIKDYGHQDCLIGKHARTDVFEEVARFLK